MPAPPAGVVLRTYLRGICGRSGCGKNWRIGRGLAMRAVETLGTGMEAAEPGIIPVKTRPQWLRGGPRLARLAWLRWRWQITFLFGGCMIGVAGVVMALGAAAAERQFARLLAAYPYASLLVTPAGFAWLAWVTRRFVPNSEGSGIPQAIAARRLWDQNERRRLVSLKIGLGKILLTLAGLLCGASIGREGPTVQVGASIMFAVGRLSPARQRGLILAGAAAGIAAAFNTPLAGVVFAIEEMSRAFDERANTLVIGAIIAAGLVSSAWLGNYTYFGVTAANLGSGVGWAAVPLCGVASGNTVFGTGYQHIKAVIDHGAALPLRFGILKMVATTASSVAGIPGGLFSPSLAVGGGIGYDIARLLPGAPVSAIVILGMVGYFSGVVQAPITAFTIVAEMTADHNMLVPLMATSLIGTAVSRLICSEGVYHILSRNYLPRGIASTGSAAGVPDR